MATNASPPTLSTLPTLPIPPDIAKKLREKYGELVVIAGEACYENPNLYIDRVTNNYGRIKQGFVIQVYKKTKTMSGLFDVITTLLLLPNTKVGLGDAHVFTITGTRFSQIYPDRKCRAEYATVLSNDYHGIVCNQAMSIYSRDFIYQIGETVKPVYSFCDQECFAPGILALGAPRYEPCESGVHFFLCRKDAETFTI